MEPIAIVGMAGRFPAAADLDQYWANLREGVETVRFFSDEELAAAGVPPEVRANPRFVPARCTLDGAELFDNVFFGLSPREAQAIDPQHRVFLEAAWEALERAGYAPGTVPLDVGVYAGTSMNTYLVENALSNPEALLAPGGFQLLLANDKDFLATRASYKLNLRGPSVTIQTACSTSLVAIQLACQGLLARQCEMALAGGVSIIAPRVSGYLYEQGMILSPDGHCRAFDAQARGTILGEGVGVLVLKRLADALDDGDHIHAVIRGASLNNDGSNKVGFTAPSVDGQADVIARAHAMAGIDPDTISYIEAHGTGTELGDPIEIAGLTQAFRLRTERRAFCAIGSVKTNIGHLDAAAGVAGLIKTVLALENRALPPSLNFTSPNPAIDFAATPFYVNAKLAEWKQAEGTPRRAGVSSFGIGGTNAHVVVEEAPERAPSGPSRPLQVLTLSAKGDAAAERMTAALGTYLATHDNLSLADVAYTLHVGRSTFPHRRVIIAASCEDAAQAIAQNDTRRVIPAVEPQKDRPVVFMFSGQGSQYVGMGRGLYETEPVFREQVDACSERLAPLLGFDLREILYPPASAIEAAHARLSTTAATQPALFVIEYALAQMFIAWGVKPRAMIGHSIGEYVAATLAGVIGRDDALRLVAERGRLMEVPGGAMIVVPMAERDLSLILPAGLSIAAVNGPALCAVSGRAAAIEAFKGRLAQQGVEAQSIHAAAAFHSAMMEPILEPFVAVARTVTLSAPALPYLSNVTGQWMSAEDAADPGYWARHIRQTVRFWDALQEVTRDADPLLLELGPGHTLAMLARQASKPKQPVRVLSSLRHPHDQQSDAAVLQTTLGRLWLAGVAVDWTGYHEREQRRRVPLPAYPFDRQPHWIPPATSLGKAPERLHQLVRRSDLDDWFYVPSWRRGAAHVPASDTLTGAWLLFADDVGIAAALAARLTAAGARVTTVLAGTEFRRLEGNAFSIDPGTRDDYDRLVGELRVAGCFPLRILHLWNVATDDGAAAGIDAAGAAQARGFLSLMFLAQAVGDHGVREPVDIGVVVNGIHDVSGEPVFRPERATVLGPSIAIPREMANVSSRLIDIELGDPADGPARIAAQLLGEMDRKVDAHVVAYRGRHRWVQDWESVQLNPVSAGSMLRERGVYVITGGLGGIGLTLAQDLVARTRARLILIARSALPPREQWQAWLADHDGDATSTKIRAMTALEDAGAEVVVAIADVADPGQLARALDEGRRRFGAINGVIHAAGLLEPGIIQLKTRATAERVISAKLAGTLALWQELEKDKPDFLFLCSSISTAVGGPGLADYRAANAFLDAFARSQSTVGSPTRVVSVKFDAWQEVGMAVALGEARDLPNGILPAEGAAIFARALASDVAEVVVSTRDLPRLIALARNEEAIAREAEPADDDAVTPAPSAASASRGGLTTPYVAPTTDFERAIAQIWQKLLGIDSIGTQDDFFEAGGHSLLATQVMSRLYQRYDVDVPLRTLFEATTVGAFAERVEQIVRASGVEREEFEL
jgi:acyl transferase domain-containing protein/acyl carrier protein